MTHDIRLWLYPGVSPDTDPSTWGLDVDISAYLRRPGQDGGQAITYSGGKGDEAPSIDAGQMTLTLDNRDGRFSTDNRSGPYYGLLDINNPIRMGVTAASDNFTRAASSSTWGVVDAALSKQWSQTVPLTNWTTDGTKGGIIIPTANTAAVGTLLNADARDVDVVTTITPSAIATGARYAGGIRVRTAGSTGYYLAALLSFDLLGAMRMDIVRFEGAGSVNLADINPLPSSTYTAGQAWKLRMTVEGNQIRCKAWPASGSEPAAWQATATDNSGLMTGDQVGVYVARYASNTNSGAVNLMTFDDFTVTGLEFTGAVVSWPLRWDKTGSNSWAPITAAGVLRRIRQGSYPIQSPLRRQLAATADVSGYWPLEDGPRSRQFSAVTPGVIAATYNGVTPAADTTLAGGGVAPTLDTASGLITANTTKVNTGTGFSAMFLFRLGTVPSVKTKIATIRSSKGPIRRWELSLSDTTLYVEGIDGDGSVLTSATNSHGEDFTEWHAWQLETDNTLVPTFTSWSALLHAVGETAYGAQTGTVSGTTLSVVSGIILTGPADSAFAHIWLGQNTLPFVTDSFSLVSSGYAGELAADRFGRVCTETGIPYILRPGGSEAMGAQREAGTLAVLESCVQADYGVMSERGAGLEFIPREARWNAAVTMAVTVAAGQIRNAPEPTRDDQRLRNRWTVSRTEGGEATYTNEDDVARHGIWEDSATINVADDSVLENHAAFRTALGVVQRLRWPSVTLDFARNPTLIPAWRTRGYGWRLTITTGRDQVDGNEPDLIVEGFTATLDPDNWTVDLNCSDASIWRAAVTDDTGILGRADNGYCETTGAITSTATTIPITTTSGLRWDNTAGLWTGGVNMLVGNEVVTVTSITNGVNPAQTLNLSARGVDGYSSTHPSGTVVRLADPAIVAL